MKIRSRQFDVAQVRDLEAVQIFNLAGKTLEPFVGAERVAAIPKLRLLEIHVFEGLPAHGLADVTA